MVQSGDVFNDYGGPDAGAIHQIFTYNGRSELTAAGTYLGATATDQSLPLSARRHEFDYDGIGNRKWSNTSGSAAIRDNYTTNELNQYVSRENNTLAVGGTVANDANIKVAARLSGLAGRQGRHWGDNVAFENSTAPFQGDLTIYAVNPVANTKMVTTRTAFIPPAAQTFTYDADGNLTSDGVWTYEWDAENRLWAMQTTANALAGGVPAQRLEFKYDYLHRRVEKLVRGGWNGSVFTTVTAQRRYLYDGWSLIAEFSLNSQLSTLNLIRTYTWGLDIARSLTDAGGVGALLQIHDYAGASADYLPSYDGNGNLAALFDAGSGACVAAYEYSPYGEFLRCEGIYAKENPFRFSTKFTDDESGLVYYGRRYYSPAQGRFLGRDPAQESSGLNHYSFCRNNSINFWDIIGMMTAYLLEPRDVYKGTRTVTEPGTENLIEEEVWETEMVWVPYQIGDETDMDGSSDLPRALSLGSASYRVTVDKSGIRIGDNIVISNQHGNAAETFAAIAFLMQNSPTFSASIDALAGANRTYTFVPISNTTGGSYGQGQIQFGTGIVTARDDGVTIYPAYTLAHEVGHAVDDALDIVRNQYPSRPIILSPSELRFGGGNSNFTDPTIEAYATRFANQVSDEVMRAVGVSIGQNSYYGQTAAMVSAGQASIARGPILPPLPKPPGG